MQDIVIRLYSIGELSGKAKEIALNEYRDINTEHQWWDYIFDDFKAICTTLGIDAETKDMHFSGFYSQGDGSTFSAVINVPVLVAAIENKAWQFPEDFMFQLTDEEFEVLRSQIVTSSWGGARYLPYAFTEQGVAMLSSVLKSETAIQVNIQIIRLFTKMRELIFSNKDILLRLAEIEKKVGASEDDIKVIFSYLHELLQPVQPPRNKIGFRQE